jgi:hypothetical protein
VEEETEDLKLGVVGIVHKKRKKEQKNFSSEVCSSLYKGECLNSKKRRRKKRKLKEGGFYSFV